jgi:hypothetical protein
MNKSQVTQERIYSEERKRGRALGITKEVSIQQKQGELRNSSRPYTWIPGKWQGKLKIQQKGNPDVPGDRMAILAAG